MYIFQKRPLSLILCITLCVFFVFSTFDNLLRFLPIPAAVLLFVLSLSIKRLRKVRITLIIASISIILSILASFLYFDCYFKANERFHEKVNVEATVLSIENSTSYSSLLTVKSKSVDDNAFSRYKFVMNIKIEESTGLEPGDHISFKANLIGFDSEGDFEAKKYFYSKGISASAEDIEDFTLTQKGNGTSTAFFSKLREALRRKAILMSDEESGNLLSALLTGERDELSGELRQNFKRIGISHVLALSGMHLAILSLAINKLLKLFFVNKRIRSCVIILFSIFYMGFVGFTVSVVRAGIMLILSSLLFLIFEESDSITSLSVAVFLIVCMTPYAIYDVALWLSAFATLGVIISINKTEKDSSKTKLCAFIGFLKSGLMSSIFAISATLLISIITFGGFSLIAPISTIVFSILIEAYMYLGSIMLILGLIFMPLGFPLGFVLKYLYLLIKNLAGAMSAPDFAYLPANYYFIYVLVIVFTVIFFTLLIVKMDRRLVSLIILISFVSLYVSLTVFKISEDTRNQVIYFSDEKSDMLLLRSGKNTALINSSQYSKGLSYDALGYLNDNHINSLDKYIITHYAYRLEEDFDILLSNILISEISLPFPKNEDEERLYNLLSKSVEEYSVELTLHAESGTINLGNFRYIPLYSHAYGEGSSHNAYLLVYKNTTQYLYLSSGMLCDELLHTYEKLLPEVDVLIFGSHGKKYKEYIYLEYDLLMAKKIIFSGEKLFLTQDAYRSYIKKGCEIYSHPYTVKILDVK